MLVRSMIRQIFYNKRFNLKVVQYVSILFHSSIHLLAAILLCTGGNSLDSCRM